MKFFCNCGINWFDGIFNKNPWNQLFTKKLISRNIFNERKFLVFHTGCEKLIVQNFWLLNLLYQLIWCQLIWRNIMWFSYNCGFHKEWIKCLQKIYNKIFLFSRVWRWTRYLCLDNLVFQHCQAKWEGSCSD